MTDDAACTNIVDASSSTGTWLADGSACNDGNACTGNDACSAGACTGAPLTVPTDVTNVAFQSNKQTLTWDSALGAGPGTVHEIPRGLVSQLPVGSGAGEICLATTAAASTNDPATPGIGASFWYLVRGQNSCGTGSYGVTSNLTPRITTICP